LQAGNNPLFGIVAYRAGVYENGVGLFDIFAYRVIGHFHDGGDDFAVGHIHLATVCFDEKFLFVHEACLYVELIL